MINHPIPPIYDKNSKILILGSFPSVKSREVQFFYGHPSNRFWKVISNVFDTAEPKTLEQKRQLLLSNNIAVWDVIASCNIEGSADSSIKNIKANDLSAILYECDIKSIYVNGKASQKAYNKYIRHVVNRDAIYLPSTSAANAQFTLDKLIDEWKVIKEFNHS